jgi:hypothetical protein
LLHFIRTYSGKGKFVSVYAMEAYRGSGGAAPPILNLDLDGGECLIYVPIAVPFGKSFQCPVNMRLGGTQRNGRSEKI